MHDLGTFWDDLVMQNHSVSKYVELEFPKSQLSAQIEFKLGFFESDREMHNVISDKTYITLTSRSSGTTGSSNQRTSYCSIDLGETFFFFLRIAMKLNIYLTAWGAGA